MTSPPRPDFRAFVVERTGEGVSAGVRTLQADVLAADGVTVQVEWSGVNYKDALTTIPDGGVARISPLIPGTDLAGTVIASHDPTRPVGMRVLAHGHAIGTGHHGGFAALARVPGAWTLPIPPGMTAREAMSLGTAGFTAARCVDQLERRGLRPEHGPVVVTGATGGVGRISLGILLARGYEAWALTRKPEGRASLADLGVAGFVEPSDMVASGKALSAERWAGAIDAVGPATLPWILRTLRHGAAVAATGNVSGRDLTTSVMPFLLRDVAMLGVASASVPEAERAAIWERLAGDLRPLPDAVAVTEIGLDDLPEALATVRAGDAQGRFLLRPAG